MTRLLRPEPWMDRSVCGEVDPEIFFPELGAITSQGSPVRALCRSCDVRVQCLSFAIEHGEEGIWGGFTGRARESVRARHRAGVPLEDIIAEDDENYFRHAEWSAETAAASAELRKARWREGEGRRLELARIAARASADARAARVKRELAESEAAAEQRCTGPCGLVKALGDFSLRKGRRRYRVCKRCRADAELVRLRQAAELASPDIQPRKAALCVI